MMKTVPVVNVLLQPSFAMMTGCCKKTLLTLLSVALGFLSMAQTTFITKAPGNWTNPATWVGGVAPNPTIKQTDAVIIKHAVTFNYTTTNLIVSGSLQVLGDTLYFPAGYSGTFKLSNAAGGLLVKNGGVLQSFASASSQFIAVGSHAIIENAWMAIAGDFILQNGGTCRMTNSTIRVGTKFTLLGNDTQRARDTIQYSTIESAVISSGDFSITYGELSVANADIRLGNSSKIVNAATGTISTAPGAACNFGFDVVKASSIQNEGIWNARLYSYCIDGDLSGNRKTDIDVTRERDCNLTLPPPASAGSSGQMVLNEVYTTPGTGTHEFFELYNINNQPEPMDNYTLLAFFDIAGQKGFYTVDFPNVVTAPKGFFVGAAAFPFNYQGTTNASRADFDWNKLNASKSGSLKKWVVTNGTGNLADGNFFYDESPLPSNFNDLFYRSSGDVSYSFLLYKNGILVNKLVAGAGPNRTLGSTITSMPALFVNMAGSSPDFTINFNSYVGMPVENINSDSGSDNGFTRTADGVCSSFRKSSNSTKHTPGVSNGALSTNTTGDVTVNSSIARGTPATGSTVTYTVFAPTSALPVELRVIVDDGSVPGQLDVLDTQVDYRTATASGQTFSTVFQPYDKDIFIMIKQGWGCIDRLVMPSVATAVTLPVQFTQFTAARRQSSVQLDWIMEEQKDLRHFMVQRSTDGRAFHDISTVLPNDKDGLGYQWKDGTISEKTPVYYYRIKAVLATGGVVYSSVRTISLHNEGKEEPAITVFPNPVKHNLNIAFPAGWLNKTVRFEIYNSSGVLLRSGTINNGGSSLVVEIENRQPGMYLLKAACGNETAQQRFVKN